jgi:hypothetical protein
MQLVTVIKPLPIRRPNDPGNYGTTHLCKCDGLTPFQNVVSPATGELCPLRAFTVSGSSIPKSKRPERALMQPDDGRTIKAKQGEIQMAAKAGWDDDAKRRHRERRESAQRPLNGVK